MLEQQAGSQLTHVPYKGTGPALQELIGGQVDMTFGTPPLFIQHLQSDTLRALAVTGKTPLPPLPDVRTAAEAGMPKFDATSWFAVFAPAKTSQVVVDRLTGEIAKIAASPGFRQKAAEQVAAVATWSRTASATSAWLNWCVGPGREGVQNRSERTRLCTRSLPRPCRQCTDLLP